MAPSHDLGDPPAPPEEPLCRPPASETAPEIVPARYALPYSVRAAEPEDAAQIRSLLMRAYGRLLAPDYSAEDLAAALPELSAAHPAFLSSPTCFIAEGPCGRILGCGGWSDYSPYRARSSAGLGHIHHIAADPDQIGRGIGSAIFAQVLLSARLAGIARLNALATRTAKGFFRAQGMQSYGEVAMRMTPEVRFAAEDMRMEIAPL
ncbi:GNAT family N-acetyltransferase [Litorivita sp. NS0012-18]|uniref:GNAT family N-acetyltransferase n=1 Tax=Litorivita sp. NS0012-18 TaxID=3127655 RepID=UPI003104E8B6